MRDLLTHLTIPNAEGSSPLPSLLWTALDGLEQAHIRQGAGRAAMPSLDEWSNLLRALDAKGVDARELPAMLRLSRRAVRTRVTAGVRKGWVEVSKYGRGRTVARLTARGSEVAARWQPLQEAAEERWTRDLGTVRAARLRAVLEVAVARIPLELPHYPASYGLADASITGGYGQDWKSVPRSPGDTVSFLPVGALLSELIVAFAMDYETRSPVALSLSTTILLRIPPQGCAIEEIGHSVGVSALHRHGFVRIERQRGTGVIHLTSNGTAVRENYHDRIKAVETEWRDRPGGRAVLALRTALEAVVTAVLPPH
jgi:hypothetical protein